MPLPQQVIEQLSHESEKTPGWSSGILFFSGTVFAIVLVIYLGLTFGYEPYLNGAIREAQDQMNTESQSISSADEAQLVTYYSQVVNLQSLVTDHVIFSQFLSWLEQNTEANVYYGNMGFASGNTVTLAAFAKTQADVNQQIYIFESSPKIQGVSVPSISFSPSALLWTFNVTLTLQPGALLWSATSSAPADLGTASAVVPAATSSVTTSTSL